MDIEVAAKLAEISLEEFKLLNAGYNRPVILSQHAPTLLLPTDKVDIFKSNLEAYTGKLSSWRTYTAKSGESFASIAKQHGITLGQLRKLNGIGAKQSLAVAQTLLVPAESGGVGLQLASLELTETAGPSTAKAARGNAPAPRNAVNGPRDVVVLRRQANVRTHTVKSGDTLFALAKRYNTSVDELRKLNNLKGNTLARGTQLRVPGTAIRG
jgi:membrane-bound lytic murein transglycosylase D